MSMCVPWESFRPFGQNLHNFGGFGGFEVKLTHLEGSLGFWPEVGSLLEFELLART